VPDQSLHSTALCSDGPLGLARPLRRFLLLALSCGCTFSLILTIMSARSLAQQPLPQQPYSFYPGGPAPDGRAATPQYPNRVCSFTEPAADNPAAPAPTAQLSFRDQGPNDLQTEIVRPIPTAAGDPNSLSPGSQPWTGGPPDRLAQVPAGPEVMRPGAPLVPPTQPAGAAAAGVQPPSEPSRAMFQSIASPFDPTQFRLPTLGLPPGLGTPEPTPEVQREYGQFVEREIVPENTIRVVVGRAKVIVLREKPRRIYIPDENVAGFQVVTDQEFAVVGKKPGSTVLNLWFPDPSDPNDQRKDRTLSYMVVVLPDPERAALEVIAERRRLEAQVKAFEQALKVLEREIKVAFPDSAVQLSLVGEQVVVRGQAKDVVEAAQILRIVAEHTPTRRRSKVESRSVNVAFIPGLGDEQAAVNAIRELLEGNANLVNLLRIPGEQQVKLLVTVAEVNRNAARSVGINFDMKQGAAEIGQFTGGLLTALGSHGTSVNLPVSLDNGQTFIAIQALRTLNLARSLAEPNLTALNGRAANYLVGVSFPIPTSVVTPGGAAQSVSYQNTGISLQFVPYITDRDRIRLQVSATVSTPSVTQTQVSGAAVPSQITQRQFSTTVELRDGQTLTVAGLIQNNMTTQSNRVPLWGDLPIIGRTGGLDNVASQEQELVVLVTPLLVHPLDMCKTPPLPGNDVFEPGDVEFYLLGHLEGRRTQDYRASVRTDYCRQKRYCDCDDLFIIGPHGSSYGCCKTGNGPCLPCPPAAAGNPPPEPVPTPAPGLVQPPAR
jgi:pilus assembly protein CpaC